MKTLITTLILLFALSAFAQESDEASEHAAAEKAAGQSTNPLSNITKLQVQPNFTWKDNSARTINVTTRIIQPTPFIFLPGIKSKNPEWYTIFRLEVPIIGQSFPNGNKDFDAVGLSDLILIDAVVKKTKWGMVGFGPGLIIPMKNPAQISIGKWGLGPSAVVFVTKVKGISFGVLAQQYWTFKGDENKDKMSFMIFQPIFNAIFNKGYFLSFSPLMNFNWTKSTYNIPLGLNFGKAFAKNLSAWIGPEYVVYGPQKGHTTLKFQINAMF
ncbi:hypothetical protein [Lentimicrobium sp. S6]|uniref:hypothetical protein n=1 Tax=Lentimicrobium sp. S6 TaxID=2735872 RepID=UPI001555FFD1|nr:hypothetical protein [Lentimicrobium sp. S6]NPD47745.1 hypothetical protein [Lentimicrobium sp. S6]